MSASMNISILDYCHKVERCGLPQPHILQILHVVCNKSRNGVEEMHRALQAHPIVSGLYQVVVHVGSIIQHILY